MKKQVLFIIIVAIASISSIKAEELKNGIKILTSYHLVG